MNINDKVKYKSTNQSGIIKELREGPFGTIAIVKFDKEPIDEISGNPIGQMTLPVDVRSLINL